MTKEEALIYLPVQDEDDLQDVYDERLFELKQFFLNRFPMSKLIDSRLNKFDKIENAFVVLGGAISAVAGVKEVDFPLFDSIKEAHKWYNREKNAIRLRLSSARSGKEVEEVLREYVRLTKHYAQYWKVPVDDKSRDGLKIAVEPNPMDIQEALDALSDAQIVNSDFISSLPDENHLKSEAKRLSLWLNFESNEQSIR